LISEQIHASGPAGPPVIRSTLRAASRRNAMDDLQLIKLNVVGSIPIARSTFIPCAALM
jgi:hypothetical protein